MFLYYRSVFKVYITLPKNKHCIEHKQYYLYLVLCCVVSFNLFVNVIEKL